MGDEIGSVTVVGGGDCGLLTALAIEKLNPDLRIEVVDDFEGSRTDVGKSTYHAILTLLHDFLDIDEGRFLREVKPIWKASVFFRDWCGYEPFHFPFDMKAVRPEADDPRSGEYLYHYYETQDITTLCEQIVTDRTSPLIYAPSGDTYSQYPYMAYHLSIDRFNEFLRTLCREREIVLIDDEITNVRTDGNRIDRVESETRTYDTDLYVDATGFNRLLMDHLEADFRSFDIPLDSAFHAVADNSIEDVLPATVVETGEHGWFWQIDTYDGRDLGYVFASEYVSEEEALSEFRAHRDEELTDVETYRFDSGFYRNAWVGNCIANGNAEQSAAIATIIVALILVVYVGTYLLTDVAVTDI
jgi:tryptophan halogenase